MADRIVATVRDEAEQLAAQVSGSGQLAWDDVIVAWWRVVRRVVLGDPARDDHETIDLLSRQSDSHRFPDADDITAAELKRLAVMHLEILRERV